MTFVVTNKGVNKATGNRVALSLDQDGKTIIAGYDENDDTNKVKIVGTTTIAGYDASDDANRIKTVQKKFRDNFEGTSLKSAAWEEFGTKGNGTVSVSAGALTITSGTTINSDFGIISKDTYTIPFRFGVGLLRSQRIANNSLIIEAVSVNETTGAPDGLNTVAIVFDGTTVTQAKYRVKANGLADLDSAASTFPTTASLAAYEIEPFSDECWFHGSLVDSTNGRVNSYRRHQRLPDPNAKYKIRIRSKNEATAPASSTTNTINFVNVQDYTEITAEITGGRGQAVAGQSIGVIVSGGSVGVSGGSVGVSGTLTSNEGTPVSPATHFYTTTASTNLVNVKASAGNLYSMTFTNYTASPLYVKLYNKASAPVVASDLPVHLIIVPATSDKQVQFGSKGLRLTTGISFAITGAIADTDTTTTTAGAMRVCTSYI
jgi:hypothetical protein